MEQKITLSRIEVKKINGRWYINGRSYKSASLIEKDFFNEFLLYFKNKKEASEKESECKKL